MTPIELVAAFFIFVLLAFGAVAYVFVLRPAQTAQGAPLIPAPLTPDERSMHGPQAVLVQGFRLIGEALPAGVAQGGDLRRKLMQAGFRWPSAVSIFLGVKCATSALLGLLAAWLYVANRSDASNFFLPAICGIGFGYLLPDRILDRMAAARANRLRRALPSALDLMVLGIEAGQGLDAAILETSRGLRLSHPDLASEFTQLHLELRAKTSREEALRNFGMRGGDPELKKFAALLVDTDRFGTSLGPALRTHAKYLRTRLRQSAQERARKVGVKLIFPVFFLIFPSVILVTLGPAAIMLFGQLKTLLGQ
jgi:tight adherence protein C